MWAMWAMWAMWDHLATAAAPHCVCNRATGDIDGMKEYLVVLDVGWPKIHFCLSKEL